MQDTDASPDNTLTLLLCCAVPVPDYTPPPNNPRTILVQHIEDIDAIIRLVRHIRYKWIDRHAFRQLMMATLGSRVISPAHIDFLWQAYDRWGRGSGLWAVGVCRGEKGEGARRARGGSSVRCAVCMCLV